MINSNYFLSRGPNPPTPYPIYIYIFFCHPLAPETREAHDRDAVGAISLAWGLIRKFVPQEIIDTTVNRLEEHGFGGMMTRDLAPGEIK